MARKQRLPTKPEGWVGAAHTLANVFRKARFWKKHAGAAFNDRQRDMLNRLLNGFEGKLTTSKWAQIEKCSQDTAVRDIDDLVARDLLRKDPAGGRSTSYSLVEPKGRRTAVFAIYTLPRLSAGSEIQ